MVECIDFGGCDILHHASGFYDYEGRDLAAYRRDVLARVLGLLSHAGLWRAAAESTRD